MNKWTNSSGDWKKRQKIRVKRTNKSQTIHPKLNTKSIFFFSLSRKKRSSEISKRRLFPPPPQRKLFDYLENERKRRGKKAEKRKEKIEQHRVSLKFLIFLQDPRITPREANVWTKCSSALPLSKANTRKRREITERRSEEDTMKKIVAKKRIELEGAEKFRIYAWFG